MNHNALRIMKKIHFQTNSFLISYQTQQSTTHSQQIPSGVKKNAGWCGLMVRYLMMNL